MSEKPVLPVPTSPVAAIASIKQQHPHLIACPEFFLSSISPSPSLSIPRQPLVCRPLPPLIPPPPLQAHTTAIMGYSDADKLAINTIRVLAVRITPHPSIIPRGFTPPPPFRWCCCSAPPSMEGGQKKETMVFSASNHGNARGGMKMQSMGCAVAHHSRVTGRCHRTCQLRPPRRANVRNPDELRCRPVPTNALSGAWRLLPTSSGTSS